MSKTKVVRSNPIQSYYEKKEKNDIPRDNESTPERHKPKKIDQ